jgi:hypothetical protein
MSQQVKYWLMKTSSNFRIFSMSFIKSRLDISNLFATKKKPCRETAGLYYFQTRQELALVRGWK